MNTPAMQRTFIRSAFLLESDPLKIYALETLFKDQFHFQAFHFLDDLQKASKSLAAGSFFQFVNIALVSIDDLSATFKPEVEAIDYTLFYASNMDSNLLSERIHYLLSIRAKALALEASPQMLKYSISCLENRVQFYCSKVTDFLLKRIANGRQASSMLSDRESEILAAMAKGKSSKQIAGDLNICTRTVEAHRQKIMRKLKTNNVAQCIQEANRLNLIN